MANLEEGKVNVSKVIPSSSIKPVERTYHSATIIKNLMIVIAGEARGDLRDFWVFDLDARTWAEPEVIGFESFVAKRFHTANTLTDSKIVTFGGCYQDYVYLNDMHVFDLSCYVSGS